MQNLEEMRKIMEEFEKGTGYKMCIYGCCSCGVMVFEPDGFDMEKRSMLLNDCGMYSLNEEEKDDYDTWSLMKKKTNNQCHLRGRWLLLYVALQVYSAV